MTTPQNAASSRPTPAESVQGQWECDCGVMNAEGRSICSRCGKINRSKVSVADEAAMGVAEGWYPDLNTAIRAIESARLRSTPPVGQQTHYPRVRKIDDVFRAHCRCGWRSDLTDDEQTAWSFATDHQAVPQSPASGRKNPMEDVRRATGQREGYDPAGGSAGPRPDNRFYREALCSRKGCGRPRSEHEFGEFCP